MLAIDVSSLTTELSSNILAWSNRKWAPTMYPTPAPERHQTILSGSIRMHGICGLLPDPPPNTSNPSKTSIPVHHFSLTKLNLGSSFTFRKIRDCYNSTVRLSWPNTKSVASQFCSIHSTQPWPYHLVNRPCIWIDDGTSYASQGCVVDGRILGISRKTPKIWSHLHGLRIISRIP